MVVIGLNGSKMTAYMSCAGTNFAAKGWVESLPAEWVRLQTEGVTR